MPEDRGYQLKEALLGKALTNDAVEDEKLSKTLALGVLSSDCISSSAYGSEMMLLVMLPVFGMAAYDVLLPLTLVVLAVLVVVTMTYRQVVMIYTKAGGSYVVARENFGPVVAQVAAVALMLDYIVTVAVQAAAGTNALTSALPGLSDYSLWITVAVVVVLAYGNLRGLREAGRAFAFPTYFFVAAMAMVLAAGVYREVTGDLPQYDPLTAEGAFPVGGGGTLLSVGGLYVVLKAFANGGSSLTGLEAISNGVSVFHAPSGRNARRTLVIMSTILGILVGGVSWLAHLTHAVPYESGSPTVISQVAHAVLPDTAVGHALFFMVQLATMLILYTGANTPFTGFPFLANFVAGDGFLPRWLRKRGHRLAFSNGILLLTVVALALLIGTGAHVDKLVAFYAIGVFTGFTLAGFGMAAYHRTHAGARSRRAMALNSVSGAVAAVVVAVFAVTKFTEGAWLVVVVFPAMVFGLLRLHRAYEREAVALADAPAGRPRGITGLNVVLVLVDNVDLAVLSALRYARGLRPQEVHSVHFVLDSSHAQDLQRLWDTQDGTDLALELIDCPDRRVDRAAVELTFRLVRDNPLAQVTVLLPRRVYGPLARLLHDRTADRIARAVSRVPGAAATIVPFDASAAATARASAAAARARLESGAARSADPSETEQITLPGPEAGHVGIGAAATRQVVTVTGRIVTRKLSAVANAPSVTYRVADQTGEMTLLFYGRRDVAGAGSRHHARDHRSHCPLARPGDDVQPAVPDPAVRVARQPTMAHSFPGPHALGRKPDRQWGMPSAHVQRSRGRAAPGQFGLPARLAHLASRLPGRRLPALILAVVLLSLLLIVLVPFQASLTLPSDLLIFMLAVFVVALAGDWLTSLVTAVAAVLLLNYYFTPPLHTLAIADRDHVVALVVFVAVAMVTSSLVGAVTRRSRQAAEAGAEVATRTALLRAVSHDLRTPLASAKAAVEGLRSAEVSWSPDEQRELLTTAKTSIDRLTSLVENLLDLSRLEAGALSVVSTRDRGRGRRRARRAGGGSASHSGHDPGP